MPFDANNGTNVGFDKLQMYSPDAAVSFHTINNLFMHTKFTYLVCRVGHPLIPKPIHLQTITLIHRPQHLTQFQAKSII